MSSICIIIPIYKGVHYIDGLIRMFDHASRTLHQVYPEVSVQLNFVNDSPETVIIEALMDTPADISCSFLNPGIHQGIHATRLYGLKNTSSDYVLFFDQDDMIEDLYLLSQYEKINEYKNGFDGVVCNGIYRGNRLIYNDNRPMDMTFDRKTLLKKQWNPLSPGQVLLRRKSIPLAQWSKRILQHNLTDDWLLWFLMAHNGCQFILNKEILYTHGEDGANSSQNWEEMGQSRIELLKILRELKVLSTDEDAEFQRRTEQYLAKYAQYIMLDKLLEEADYAQLIRGIQEKTADLRVTIYGMGVYGQKLFALLSDAGIKVSYGIDQHAAAIQNSAIPVYSINETQYPETDLVIVTALFAFEEIEKTTLRNISCPKVKMNDYIKECLDSYHG